MNTKLRDVLLNVVVLPLVGVGLFLAVWQVASVLTYNPEKQRSTLPSPAETVKQSSKYLAAPFSHNEAEGFDGLGLLTLQSLSLVARGYLVALVLGVPLGFMLGSSKIFTTTFDPIFQVLRPVSPLAWFPLAGLIMVALKRTYPTLDATTWQCVVTIAICALWPTALNTAVGVRAIPQDYLNVAKVLKLSPAQRFIKILIPASLPYMFTGFRLSLGIAWLVIVAAEMLSGKTGIGFFVFDSYNAENYGAMLMSILVIGVVGFVLDRVMSLAERNVDTLLNLPSAVMRKVRSARPARPAAARPAAGEGRSVAHAVS